MSLDGGSEQKLSEDCRHLPPEESAGGTLDDPHERLHLRHIIERAAHLLPAQGPIAVFVHHNTLHAFEESPFDEAVQRGAWTFGCQPFLPEERYHWMLQRGRIRREDLMTALIDDLEDDADVLLGFLGTRFHLRSAMLEQPFLMGPTAELRWFVAESDALRRFRPEVSQAVRQRVIEETRRWIMRDVGRLSGGAGTHRPAHRDFPIHDTLARLFQTFDRRKIEFWSHATWEAFCLHLLWRVCRQAVRDLQNQRAAQMPAGGRDSNSKEKAGSGAALHLRRVRMRDWLLEATGQDSDQLVHDVLIRFCAAFVDQGLADWSLPGRDRGFYAAFHYLYGNGYRPPERWLRGLGRELTRENEAGIGPIQSIEDSLHRLAVGRDQWELFLTQTLLALRGWAGMIWQLETRGDRVAHPVPRGTLVEMLAIRLVLERLAVAHLARESLGYRGPLGALRQTLGNGAGDRETRSVDRQAFVVFQLAQVRGWTPENLCRLTKQQWSILLREIEAFSGVARRRIFHHAYERRYRIETLDAILAHNAWLRQVQSKAEQGSHPPLAAGNGEGTVQGSSYNRNTQQSDGRPKACPSFQFVCCIDEREESFRRHLEEIAPDCETFGVAGFFALAIYYRGAADAHFVPLCPVHVKPQHYVSEEVAYTHEQEAHRRRQTRRAIGTVTHRAHLGSRTFAGGWFAAVLGSLASIPLVTRILFPRLAAQIRRLLGRFVRPPLLTRLELERSDEPPGTAAGHLGFSAEEMAGIVERLLRDIGLTKNHARLVFIVGHGSSSLNNPHESAHDCGACGGGRGGPNARAFAQMANDPRVRDLLAIRGVRLPRSVYFIGTYHNTCDDSIAFFDLDRLPSSHKSDFEKARHTLDVARQRNAHERCRRFESAELSLSPEEALRHVEGRAEDLSQVRPEYGHASNALCFVGRRQWSRSLFLDRRAFLQSYEPSEDDGQHTVLSRILQAVIPVCAGINLEYYFSYIDPTGYGCGTKLPHNVTSLLGVMNGAASDLLPGLPWQMVEIHEPLRLLLVIETTTAAMLQIMEKNEHIARLCRGHWIHVATYDPASSEIQLFRRGQFEPYRPERHELPMMASSADWYRGWRDHLGFAIIVGSSDEHA